MSVERFARSELVATPWKNGGGLTREIVCRPSGSDMDSFTWRASIAEIKASGAFSVFAGVDRVIVLLTGDGVHLRSSDGRVDHRLATPLAPYSFSGDDAIDATLLGGASSDFNVMTRRSAARAEVRVIRDPASLTASPAGVLYVSRGTWRATAVGSRANEATHTLAADTGIWWDSSPITWHLTPLDSNAAIITSVVIPNAATNTTG